jgi:pimeloyl-ACP methyl ester carboxylesterase
MKRLTLLVTLLLALPLWADEKKEPKKGIVGIWQGTLKVGAIELRLAFHIMEKEGKFSSKMDSIDQGAKDIPVNTTEFADSKLTLKIPAAKIVYTGTLQADGDTIKGEFDQGMKMTLDLKRVDKVTELKRPQHPKIPYPYHAEDVTFDSNAKAVKLAGTFTKPKGDGPYPTVVLISGSGPQDRNEELMGHKPFLVLADYLARKGIAVLRYDDRGVGKSTGDHEKATTKDFAADAAGAVAWLKARQDVGKIGLMGHSEGGLIAPLTATESADVGFIIMLAGPGIPGDEILNAQRDLILKAAGVNEETRKKVGEVGKKLIDLVKAGADKKKLIEASLELEKSLTADELKALGADKKADGKAGEAALDRLLTPWFKFFLNYDPRPTLQKVKCPVLAINGELDLQVPFKENLDEIAKAVKAGGNNDVTTKAFPKLNHLFQTCATGHPKEYGQIEETFAPAALDLIVEWINKRK